jgi:hypothetical protein
VAISGAAGRIGCYYHKIVRSGIACDSSLNKNDNPYQLRQFNTLQPVNFAANNLVMKKIPLFFFCISLLSMACTKSEITTSPGGNGTVSGKIRAADGTALANVTVVIEHTVWQGNYILCTTDGNGDYSANIPANPAGSWTVKAQLKKDAYGKQYVFDLYTSDNEPVTLGQTVVRNFTWKLSGTRPNGGHFGAHVDVYQFGTDVNPTDVKIQLTPLDATLIDGSSAAVIERRIEDVAGTFMIKDIPIGRYKAKAIYPGRTLLLKNRQVQEEPGVEKTFVFGKNAYLAETDYNVEFWLSE